MNETDALWAFLVAAAVAFVLTPLAARLARRTGAVAEPRERDLHDRPMPRLGGLAILAGVLAAGALFMPGIQETRGILGGGAVAAAIGAVDDRFALPWYVKLVGQFGAAAVAVWSGVRVDHVTLPFLDPLTLGNWGYPLTLVGMVAVM